MLTIKDLHHIAILLCFIFPYSAQAASMQLLQKINTACTVLGVTVDDAPSDINKKYHLLAKKFHPDRSAEKDKAADQFKEINNAHALLSDENCYALIKEALTAPAASSAYAQTEPLPKRARSDGSFSWRDYTQPKRQHQSDNQLTRELRGTLYNACFFLGVQHSDSKNDIHAKFALHMERFTYRPLSLSDQTAATMTNYAKEILLSHYAVIKRVSLDPLSAPFIKLNFSREETCAAVHIIQDKKSVWQPSLNYMRCYHWVGLIETIRYGSVDEVRQFLVPNPYLFTMNVQFEKNPDLQDLEERARLALEAAHLSVYHLVNMDDGYTAALTVAHDLMLDPPAVSCRGITPKERAKAIYDLLVAHGAHPFCIKD